MMKWIGVAAIAVLLAWASVSGADSTEYFLYTWPYGAIAWIGETGDGCADFAQTAANTVVDVFELWGFKAPVPMVNWETPWSLGAENELTAVVSKTDPATGERWRLTALTWRRRPVFPLLLIVFPDRVSLSEASGVEHAGFFSALGPGQVLSHAEPWLMLLADAPCIVLVSREDPGHPGYTYEFVLTHELAHWMTQLHCNSIDLAADEMPRLLFEGIAEYTAWRLAGTAATEERAREWAAGNELTATIEGRIGYDVGASVIDVMLEEKSPQMFLSLLKFYAANLEYVLQGIEPRWRAHLGLPPE